MHHLITTRIVPWHRMYTLAIGSPFLQMAVRPRNSLILFSLQWWLLLVLLFIPWIVWWKLVDKTRIREILLYGCALSILVIYLDDIGSELQLWSYPFQLIRFIPRLNPVDISVLPVLHMMVYQYFKSWKSFFVANAVMALAFSFLAEPLFAWIGIYELNNWKHIYSLPLYIGKAMFIRWLLAFITTRSKQVNKLR